MARMTIDNDTLILHELKQLQRKEHRSLGQLISQLLAVALASRRQPKQTSSLKWVSQSMQARINFVDKETVYRVLDESSS